MISSQELFSKMFGGGVEQRLHLATYLYNNLGDDILSDRKLAAGLVELKARAEVLSQHMHYMRMGELCTKCAETVDGGCCSLYMAGETDTIQLLMNMLAGIRVGVVQKGETECCYLGKNGCIFIFKPFFCLNYNCDIIHLEEKDKDLATLTELSGRLLVEQYSLEQRILEKIVRQIFKNQGAEQEEMLQYLKHHTP